MAAAWGIVSLVVSGAVHHGALRMMPTRSSKLRATVAGVFPPWMPKDVEEIEDDLALAMARRLARVPVALDDFTVSTSFYRTQGGASRPSPVLLLHGFDSSSLEWRRLVPLLEEAGHDVIAVDMLGWGFTDREGVSSFSAGAKRAHLMAFWEQHVGEPVTLVGTSLGAAFAADLAMEAPHAVSRLALVNPQVLVDGTGQMASLPRPLAAAGVQVLRTRWLRSIANKMSYYNQEEFATKDALEVGRLQVACDGWLEGNVDYMLSGGIAVSTRLQRLADRQVLVVWGRQDQVVPPADNTPALQELLPDSEWVLIDECGHVPHLEQPAALAQALSEFHGGGGA